MYSRSLSVFFVSAVCFLAPLSISAQDNPETQAAPEFEVPQDVQSDGSFRYHAAFDIPSYRGLEPNLGLTYTSSFRGLGSAEVWLGVGWQLSGLSQIERVSLGGGTPTHDDARDLYRLDGMELLACSDGEATDPWLTNREYPTAYRTDTANASCSAGGTFSTLVESYRRVEMHQQSYNGQQVDYFVVTETDGTQYRYESLGVLAGDTVGPSDERYAGLFDTTYLLSEIRDTQATPNVVEISYAFAALEEGRAHRPEFIRYGGYEIEFGYQASQTGPLASYATGTRGMLGQQFHLLRSIAIRDGTAPLRAYAFEYQTTETIGRRLLNQVQVYGDDYSLANGIVTGGSQLPDMLSALVYTPEGLDYVEQQATGTPVHENVAAIMDVDRDGRDEILLNSWRRSPSNTIYPANSRTIVYSHAAVAAHPAITQQSSDGQLISAPPPSAFSDGSPWRPQRRWAQDRPNHYIGSTGYHPEDNQIYYFLLTTYRWTGDNDGPSGGRLRRTSGAGLFPDTLTLPSLSFRADNSGPRLLRFGNFDDDPNPEVLSRPYGTSQHTTMYDIEDSVLVPNAYVETGTNPRTGGTTLFADLAVDIDADGVTEIIASPHSFTQNGIELIGFPSQGHAAFPFLDWQGVDFIDGNPHYFSFGYLFGSTRQELERIRSLAAGDVNGDGAADLVVSYGTPGQDLTIRVALSDGAGFVTPEIWGDSTSIPELNQGRRISVGQPLKYPSYVAMRDVNGDGRADLILTDRIDESTGTRVRVHVDHDRDYNRFTGPQDLRDLFMMSYVYLSTGDGFVPAGPEQTSELLGVHGWGDINGDGIEDAIARNSPGVILYGTGDVPHLLTSIRDGFGGVTGIAYVPSTAVGNNDNDVPGVTQLVAAIERQDGRGNIRRTSYSYVGSRYDYAHRRPLGYRTITAHLPAIAGEAEGPQVVTTYLNDHLGERGRMASQTILHDGQTQRQVINAWDVRAPDLRPFRAQQTSERTRVRYGADLVETTRLFEHTRYGQVSLEVTLGFTVNGVDQDPDDNQLIRTGRAFNLSDYIVDQPGWRIAQSGSTFDAEDRARWLWREFYTHEGNADPFTAPSNSNVVRVERWTGDVSSCCARRLEEERSYDAHGNVLSQTDARGHTTTYTYDTARHLFRLSETNALGHVATTTWDTACQAPVRVTDVNGQVTDYTYDSHCRETRVDHPNGNWETTAYLNWGDPAQAFIQTQTPSGSSAPGAGISEHRQYVDGFGQTYRSRTMAMLEGELDFIFIDRAFDARGNLAWESIPLSSANQPPPGGEVAASWRTSFVYDPLNRLTNTTAADGTLSATVFGAQSIGGIMHPLVTSHDAHCFDGDSSTICGEIRLTLDSRGNTIARAMTDADQTDIDASGTERTTSYTYDLRNQLIGVTDPIGATWVYTYDVFGNRTVSDDPALGRWTMVYDANGNLTRQTDAEGQVIAITYDALNRVTRRDVTTSGGTTTTTSTYDEAAAGEHNIGQLTTLSNPDHTIRYGYDAVGQQIRAEHSFLGRSYTLETEYRPSGAVLRQHLPTTPGSTATAPTGDYSYDVAGRLNGFGTYIEAIAYNAWGNPTLIDYGNTLDDRRVYDTQRGWLTDITILDAAVPRDHFSYTRSATGRISRVDSQTPAGRLDYSYDYAGRLLTATNFAGQPAQNRVFTYDAAGSLRSNSQIGSYSYGPATGPHPHAPIAVAGQSFAYDANGNMTTSLPLTTGLAGRSMSYDGENRPLSVTHGGATTTYTYGADGTRLLRTDPSGNITATFGPVEIRTFGSPAEQVLTYPHPDIRITNGTEVTYLHRDHLNSVVAMTDASGARAEARVYAPFGEIAWRDGGANPDETFGYIGERYDSDAGLQYLNARYYDPRLAMFIQPDWFEVTEPGVGTNRYAYSANDPINHMDPGGNAYSRSDRAQEVLDNYLEHSEEFGHARDQFGSVGSGVSRTIAAKNRAAGLSGRFTFDGRGNWTSSVSSGLNVTVSTNGGLRGIARSGPLVSVLDGQRPTLGASGGGIVVGGGGFAIAMWLRDVFTRSPADVGSTATRRQYSNVMRFQIQGTALGRHQQNISIAQNGSISLTAAQMAFQTALSRLPSRQQRIMEPAVLRAQGVLASWHAAGGVVGQQTRTSQLRGIAPSVRRVDIENLVGHNLIPN